MAFSNSPPVQLTKNKRGYAYNAIPNLDATEFDNFSEFLVPTILGVQEKTGITFDYISPVNEPQWDWSDGGQEGTPFYNHDIAQITKSLSKNLTDKSIPTKITIAESGQLEYLYSAFNRPNTSNQITVFFDKNSVDYIGDLPNLEPTIAGHSYWTTSPYQAGKTKREQLMQALDTKSNLKYWMSEYCILGDNDGEIQGNGKDLGIGPALYVAKVIHNDLVNANASAWHWWTAISAYDYKDGLVYVDKTETDGSYQDSKMLWALGNYSRFIKPGAIRIGTEITNGNDGLFVSAYINTDQNMVTVITNSRTDALEMEVKGINGNLTKTKYYQTSETASLKPVELATTNGKITIPARSIVTMVGQL